MPDQKFLRDGAPNSEASSMLVSSAPCHWQSVSLYLFSERTQLIEYYIFICLILRVSAVFGHHQVDFTTT